MTGIQSNPNTTQNKKKFDSKKLGKFYRNIIK